MGNIKINMNITWVVRILWMVSFILLLFIKDFSPAWKWGYIGFIVLLAVITIFRIREAQKVWYQESDNDN